jgi:hypothetical protein
VIKFSHITWRINVGNYYNTKSFLLWSTLEPIYWLTALFARGAKADISAHGTKRVKARGGADKSVAQLTSRCHKIELIVLLEIASLFLLQRLKLSMSGNVRDFNNIETHTVIKFFFQQGKGLKEIHTILIETCTNACHRQKLGGPVVIFPPVIYLILDDPKQWPPQRLLIKFTS